MNTKLTIFKDLYRQAKHEVPKLVTQLDVNLTLNELLRHLPVWNCTK